MNKRIVRLRYISLGFLIVIFLTQCSRYTVKSDEEFVCSEVTSQKTNLELLSAPTVENPSINFRAFKETYSKDIYKQIDILRYRTSTSLWASTIGIGLASGLTSAILLKTGNVVLGRDLIGVGILPFIGTSLFSLLKCRKIEQVEKPKFNSLNLPVDIIVNKTKVTSRTYEFNLAENLDVLPKEQDLLFTIALSDSNQISRAFTIEKQTIAEIYRQREITLQRERVEKEIKLRQVRATALAEEIDEICCVYEGLCQGASLYSILLLKRISGRGTTSDVIERLEFTERYRKQYEMAQDKLTKINRSGHFEKTYKALDDLASDLPRYVQACYELITTGDLFTVPSAEYLRLHKRFYGQGTPISTDFMIPFKSELQKVGLSQTLINDLTSLSQMMGWAITSSLFPEPRREKYLPKIIYELSEHR